MKRWMLFCCVCSGIWLEFFIFALFFCFVCVVFFFIGMFYVCFFFCFTKRLKDDNEQQMLFAFSNFFNKFFNFLFCVFCFFYKEFPFFIFQRFECDLILIIWKKHAVTWYVSLSSVYFYGCVSFVCLVSESQCVRWHDHCYYGACISFENFKWILFFFWLFILIILAILRPSHTQWFSS